MGEPVNLLEAHLGKKWPNISAAAQRSDSNRREISTLFGENALRYTPSDTNIVIFGSLARDELTSKSDLDWTLLVDGEASADHQKASQAIRDLLEKNAEELGLKRPGRTGIFGQVTFSHDLVHYIC